MTRPVASAWIAGSNRPHREPTSVTSFTTAFHAAKLVLPSQVVFITTVPLGLT